MIGRAVRRFNRRILNPVTLRFSGRRFSPYATVRHLGRRTGRAYATPLLAKRVEDGFIIPLTYGEDADWARNVRARGGCTIESDGQIYEVTEPRVIDASVALPVFPVVHRLLLRLFRMKTFLSVRYPPAE